MPTSPTKPHTNTRGLNLAPVSPNKNTRHCTKCGRPTLGHPKGRCPQDVPPAHAASPAKTKMQLRGNPQRVQPIPAEVEQAERRRRRSSIPAPITNVAQLPSLTTTGKEVLERLLQPGIMDDDMTEDEDRNRANVLRWLDNIVGPEESDDALRPTNTATSSRSPTSPTRSSRPLSSSSNVPIQATNTTNAPAQLKAQASLPQIVKDKAAHAIVVDVDSILDTMKQLEGKGFQTRALWPPKNTRVREGWLVIGRDRATVDALVNRMMSGLSGQGFTR